ncbi:MAG: thiol:disulfide interchange protein [Phenylobacterium sp.]|jgi:thiol-disulfide isomerase/thioredoxin|nr:thiol:disulfide interchange protein [Phenylobacterium sp.]
MSDQSAARPRGGLLRWALWGAALIGVAAVIYIIAQASTKPPAPTVHSEAAATPPVETHDVAKKLIHPADGQAPPAYAFVGADGKKVTPADFKGKVVVMNLWATWCAPCQAEMPTLARLQQQYAGQPVAVVAVSIDKPEELAKAKAFIARNAPLAFYNDPEAKLPWALKPAASGMPTTLILGKDGLERGRISGEADWAGAGAKAVIDTALAE